MNQLILIAGTAALLGSALIAGVFFSFSSFVMKALARLPGSGGIAAMQSINVVVINPSFLGVFIGTTVVSLGMAGFALVHLTEPSALFFLGGAVFYLAGTFLVTVFGNVPLNHQLAAVPATGAAGYDVWRHYLDRWIRWNHIRTLAAIGAVLLYLMGLMKYGA